jgi:thiol-disulfide isomerase/thioredoxin
VDSISLFGLSFPLLPLLMLSALFILAMLNRWQRVSVTGFSDAILLRLLLSLLVARLVFVSQHFSSYQGQWLEWFDIRDRGFDGYSLLLVFSLLLMHYAYKVVTARRLLLLAIPLTLLWMGGGYTVYRHYHPMPERWPTLVFSDLQAQPQRFSDDPTQYRFTVVNLWASWCPPCRAEMPVLMHAQQQYSNGRFVMLNQGENNLQITQFLQQHQLKFDTVWLDTHSTMGRWLGQQALPVTLIFDADGQLIDGHAGVLSSAKLAEKLQGIPSS